MNDAEIAIYRIGLKAALERTFPTRLDGISKGLAQYDRIIGLGRTPAFAFEVLHNCLASETETAKAIKGIKQVVDEHQPRTVNGHLIEGFRAMEKGAVNAHSARQLGYLKKAIERFNGNLDKLVGIKVNGVEITQEDLDARKITVPKVARHTERFEATASLPAKAKGCEVIVHYYR